MVKVENFPNAYKEVYTILNYVDSEDLTCIPKSFIDMLKSNMNNDYKFDFDPEIEFENQNLLRETKVIFAYIFIHYWGNEKQIEAINAKFRKELMENEERKRAKYLDKNIFEKKQNEHITKEQNVEMVKYKKENIFMMIINTLKNLLK